jgi:hypothetical protein
MMRIPPQRIFPVYKQPGDPQIVTTTDPLQAGLNTKDNTMITADIPREITFELPQGEFLARILTTEPIEL